MRTSYLSRLAAIGIVVLGILGCGSPDDTAQLNQESIVVVRCENIITNGCLAHRVLEIWRDESDGAFLPGSNNIINIGIPVEKGEDVGEESILFYGKIDGKLHNSPTVFNVHVQRVDMWQNKSIDEVKRIIQTSKASGVNLKVRKKKEQEP